MAPPLFALLTVAWLALVVSAPLLPVPVGAALYVVGSFICHQRPERSFHLFSAQLPVCARCAGIYAGAAIGFSMAWMSPRAHARVLRSSPRTLLLVGAVPTMLTLLLEWSHLWAGSNVVRGLAGLPLGLSSAFVVVQAAATLHYDECAPQRPIENNQASTPT